MISPPYIPESAELASGETNTAGNDPRLDRVQSEVSSALFDLNRESNIGDWRESLLYGGLSKLLKLVARDTRTEYVYAALEIMDILNAIDLSRGREPKFPGILRVPYEPKGVL